MGIQNGKFFDVTLTRGYFGGFADEYDGYSKKANVHQNALINFVDSDSWKGKDAVQAKNLIKTKKVTLVDEVLSLQQIWKY